MTNQPREGLFPTWVLWIIGPVTVLAAALIIFAVVLGIQAGQRQVEIQRRQQVGIALQRAMDYRAEGRLQEALAEYQRVLVLDPGNELAQEGIRTLVEQAAASGQPVSIAGQTPPSGTVTATASSTIPPAAGSPPAQAGGSNVAAPTATPSPDAERLYAQALSVYQAGDWEEAIELLLVLQEEAPTYQAAQVEEMLYNCYVSLAAAADQAGELEEALAYVDKALALRPNTTALQAARTVAANYVEALSLEGKDWPRMIELLEAIYAQDPSYRDVESLLQEALLAYGDQLALEKRWCEAQESYDAAIAISVTPGSIARRDEFQAKCEAIAALTGAATPGSSARATPTPTRQAGLAGSETPAATPVNATLALGETPTPDPLGAAPADETQVDETQVDETQVDETQVDETQVDEVEEPAAQAPAGAPSGGRILFSGLDPVNGRNLIMIQPVGQQGFPPILAQDGQQAALRGDGQRMVYRNLRGDSRGLTALDPATGLELRFTTFAEDSYPTWNAEGNLIAFASNREGDRRWRIYVLWADVGNEATALVYGESPDGHPAADRLAYRGCDESGNQCGIWVMSWSGGDRRPLTTVQADTQPDWSPTGGFLAFMSDGRDGNPEIYRVDTANGEVTRLTNSPAIDGHPAVSPDGAWVAFLSNRNGAWGVWAAPSSGGEAQLLFPVDGGVGAWQDQELQWVN